MFKSSIVKRKIFEPILRSRTIIRIEIIERYISAFADELTTNGYEAFKGKRLKDFIDAYNDHFATDIDVGHKIRSLSVFDFRFRRSSGCPYKKILNFVYIILLTKE